MFIDPEALVEKMIYAKDYDKENLSILNTGLDSSE